MFILNFSVCSSILLFIFIYFVFLLSFLLYALPTLSDFRKSYSFKNKNSFFLIKGYSFFRIFFFFFLILIHFFCLWALPSSSLWFGHLIITSFSYKISCFLTFFFFFLIFVQITHVYFSSKDIFDFFISKLNFFLWTLILFWTNNIFSTIFVIEILSTLIFLLLITSTFSTTYFFNNLNLNLHNYLTNSLPFFFNQTVLFYFWTSLIASLNLFLSILFFYMKFFSFDWFFLENIFLYLINISSYKDFIFFIFMWFNFLFCIFLKCGLVPFYAWKPTFFKGSPLNFLYTYICFFYFFIFLFFIKLLIINLNEIFFFFLVVNFLILSVGFFFLLAILSETFYLKTFFAISSILNTLFVFLAFSFSSFVDYFFIL